MKKCGMIFASVIFTLVIMLIPNQEVKALEKLTEPIPSTYHSNYGYINGYIDSDILNYYIDNFDNTDLHYTLTSAKPNDMLENLNYFDKCLVYYTTSEYSSYRSLVVTCSNKELIYNSSDNTLSNSSSFSILSWVLRYSDTMGYFWRENNGIKSNVSKSVLSFEPLYSNYDLLTSSGDTYFNNTNLDYKFTGEYQTKILNLSNYDSIINKFEPLFTDFINFMEDYSSTYDYYIILHSTPDFIVYEKSNNSYNNIQLSYSSSDFSYGTTDKNLKYYSCSSDSLSVLESCLNLLKEGIINDTFSTIKNPSVGGSSVYEDNYLYDSFSYIYYANNDYLLTSNSVYQLQINDTIYKPGDKIPTYYDIYHVGYDYNIKLNPNNYNFFYLKFNSLGDSSFYFKHILTNAQDLFYMIYKNEELIYTPIVYNNTDLYIQDYFVNTNESDIYTIIVPFYKYDFLENDIFDFYFTIPGLIEYGTDKYKYTFNGSEWEEEESERSEITDLLEPSDNVADEIISSATSHNTLSNDSLNEFMWPYSLFARNGNNIKDVSLVGSFSSTSSFNISDFKTNLNINYGDETYKISINNCISNSSCYLTKFEQELIKNILFDRNVENSNYYLDFSIIPLKNLTLNSDDQFNFGISLTFNSSVELTIHSMLLAINDLSNSYYNVHFKLYDSSGKVHTIYKTSLDNEYIGVNQFQLESRTADIYRVDIMFVYNHTLENISSSDNYSLKVSEFNIFANTEMIHIYTENTEATYQTCAWYDFLCHGQNLFTWLTYDAPGSSDFWTIFLYITNVFNMLWTLITFIFMPFDIIPPIFGIPISTIMPIICFVLVIIWRMWLGGDK